MESSIGTLQNIGIISRLNSENLKTLFFKSKLSFLREIHIWYLRWILGFLQIHRYLGLGSLNMIFKIFHTNNRYWRVHFQVNRSNHILRWIRENPGIRPCYYCLDFLKNGELWFKIKILKCLGILPNHPKSSKFCLIVGRLTDSKFQEIAGT